MKLKKTIVVLLVIALCLPMISGVQAAAESVEKKSTSTATKSNTKEKETEVIYLGGNKSNKKKVAYSKSDLRLMSTIIYCEAGGEPYAGKLGVGIVVMNRVKSKRFPNTIRKVIYQRKQFSPTRNGSMKRALKRYDKGKFNSAAEKASIKAAKAVLTGTNKVVYGRRKINMKKYLFFSRYVSGRKVQIARHQFK